ncbi:DNA primase family protein [Microbacterium sp.]|uniref:DNA primase family protein n=1 Tax=Microbacterium sp. TaxID=51671 RepID=UPI003C721242
MSAATSPDWVLTACSGERERTHDRGTDASVETFRARLIDGKPDKAVRKALGAFSPRDMAHADLLDAVAALVILGVQGHPGVSAALDEARATYTHDWGSEYARAFDKAVTGSVRRQGLPPATIELSKPQRKAIKARNRQSRTPDRPKGGAVTGTTDPDMLPAAGDDATLAEVVAAHFRPSLIFAAGAWHEYDGNRWRAVSDAHVVELVRSRLLDLGVRAYLAPDGSKLAAWLKRKTTIDAAARLIRGILERSAADFDAHPDEINTPSGIVDLRTGELRPCDPDRMHTKVTRGAWGGIEARHPDVDKVLDVLPAKVRDWMQIRVGQAATGHVPDDDIVPIWQGGGQNGKSTCTGMILGTLGDYAAILPEQVLLASQGDHPTALMDLLGLRLGFSEELPEGHSLNVKRLKDIAGTPRMKARRMRQDFVEWSPSHSLMVSSNYDPRVAETDHGTWRRLALVRFPFRFVADPQHEDERPADRRLRGRVNGGKGGRDEAVLAWIVRGAMRWYDAGMVMPEPPRRVVEDTTEWRERSDVAFAFANDRLVFGPDAYMSATDLIEAVRTWLNVNGHRAWNTETIVGRVASHDMFRDNNVRKDRKRLPDGTRPTYYFGVGLRPNEAVLNSFQSITAPGK